MIYTKLKKESQMDSWWAHGSSSTFEFSKLTIINICARHCNLFFSSKSASYRVSSVLGRDVKSYGKQFLFDGEEDTCWNSDQVPRSVFLTEFLIPMLSIWCQPIHINKNQLNGLFVDELVDLIKSNFDCILFKLI